MAFYQFPGTDFHDLNLDWLLQQMKNCLAEWATTKTAWENTSQDWAGDDVVIAACIAAGRDEAGDPVYKMYHLICKDGKAQTLEEIFGITE